MVLSVYRTQSYVWISQLLDASTVRFILRERIKGPRIAVVAWDCNTIARRLWVQLTAKAVWIFIGMLILPFTPNSINVSMIQPIIYGPTCKWKDTFPVRHPWHEKEWSIFRWLEYHEQNPGCLARKKGGHPTVLWSGNGYHIYQPVDGFILEEEDVFTKFIE